MNKFNLNEKQENKLAILTATLILSLLIVVSLTISFNTNKQEANATPSSSSLRQQIEEMQPILNETSDRYTDAIMKEAECQQAVDEAQGRIDYCNEQIPRLQDDIGRTMRKQYRDGSFLGFLDVFFNSIRFEDLITGLNNLDVISKKFTNNIISCKNLKAQLKDDMELLVVKLDEAKAASSAAAAAKAEADTTIAQLQAAMDAASAEEREAASQPTGGGTDPVPGPVPAGDWSYIANIALSLCDGNHMYEWGGNGPQNFDCSGLVSYCINGGVVGRRGKADTFCGWPTCEPTPGCIVANFGHCGIYIGNNQMVHAPTFKQPVQVGSVQLGMGYHCPTG